MSAEQSHGISVVIPVGSIDDALDRQVEAVLDQTCPDRFELILALNVASPEAGPAFTQRWGAPTGRSVRVVDALDRRGAAHARNVGARAAAGDRLAFCDADDLVHPGWLDALL